MASGLIMNIGGLLLGGRELRSPHIDLLIKRSNRPGSETAFAIALANQSAGHTIASRPHSQP